MTPKYRLLAADLREAITTGQYAPGSSLPRVRDLTTSYSVSMSTVMAALAMLDAEGLVRSIPGHATVVLDPRSVHVPLSVYSRY